MSKWSWNKFCLTLCTGALTVLAAPSQAASGSYAFTDLGTLKNQSPRPIVFETARAFGINDSVQIVGDSITSFTGEPSNHAFLYNGGTMTDLGTLMGPTSEASATGYAINNVGQIAGTSYVEFGGNFAINHAFIYSGGAMRDLGTLGGSNSYGYAVNNAGQLVGRSQASFTPGANPRTDPAPYRAFLYSGGRMADLGTLGGSNSSAYGINTGGYVVGTSQVAGDAATRAFVYRGGRMIDLGTLGGANSTAYGINDTGHIVGTSDLAGNNRSHAFFHDGSAMRDLGTLGGSTSVAKAINNAGQIVGSSRVNNLPYDPLNYSTYSQAFLYENGRMINLNHLPEVRNSGWVLLEATAINNSGQIVGYGYIRGDERFRAFLLTPSCGGRNGPPMQGPKHPRK
ncbi:putative HAF family extracellular repeat protein [Paucimonas lemoignei]|uniref:Putative HAF family extracellular repeat protein n=1 Tax=Paucimonas lemoignei TaxID=29443 RepID=A0A4R3I0U7_PAULE|nr:DUF3466 family protein [Paucimonas lemoignei]TCS39346.1 putative HAF family extracellular repeat protein [Paucimonas lemoignei]